MMFAINHITVFLIKLSPKKEHKLITNTITKVKKTFKEKKFFLKTECKNNNLMRFDIKDDTTNPIGAANSVKCIKTHNIDINTTNLTNEATKFSRSLLPINSIVPHGPVIHSINEAIVNKTRIELCPK